MAVRSDNVVIGDYTATGGLDVLYTVPADRTVIVKDIRLRDLASGATYALIIQTPAPLFGQLAQETLAVNAFTSVDPPPWVVLREGWVINLFAPAGKVVRLLISGSVLFGDPE